ncbi:hypothetical protein KY290_017070 [Solanum tuberosum]|uniref:Uncharacterized protein n=1 Tax=Solanum tuberosum TaxID=4113 RepID=A0ABQ7VAA9_SOLTU|nr:hypothetical protein KY284_016136 [Solanum tuberosum]KAH0701853.1 hypothetical protein KY285_016131 [Solanum tuberosum]KAH0760997.1 hypothetical protein KY290_017070 [Solanum tuberosum]
METYRRPLMVESIEQSLNLMVFPSFSSFSVVISGEVTWCGSDIIEKGKRDVRGGGTTAYPPIFAPNPADFKVKKTSIGVAILNFCWRRR